jgi:hypothetical protein
MGAEMDYPAKFGKETVAEAHRRPKLVTHFSAQARLRYAHPQLR